MQECEEIMEFKLPSIIDKLWWINIKYSIHLAALLTLRVLVPNLSPSSLKAFLALSASKHNPKATHFDSPWSSKIKQKITS